MVSRNGSIDWLCFPRFDSLACFAALLGTPDHGRWMLAPDGEILSVRRRYRTGTLILETEYDTRTGTILVTDAMPIRTEGPDVVRIVSCARGHVNMRMELVIRFDYGDLLPWIRPLEGGMLAIAGPKVLCLRTSVPLSGDKRPVGLPQLAGAIEAATSPSSRWTTLRRLSIIYVNQLLSGN